MNNKNFTATSQYPKESAGSLITTKVPTVGTTTTIKNIKDLLLEKARDFESINYIYVLDSEKKLKGVLSIKNILSNKHENSLAKEFLKGETLIWTHPYSHQEKAAMLALKHKIKAVPVLDKDEKFLGVITNDKILSIMHHEAGEDLLKFAGFTNSSDITVDDVLTLPIQTSLARRLPWIIIGFITGVLIAEMMGLFESTIQNNVLIATFIPMMVYMSNAVGQQVTAFIIRDAAINSKISFGEYFRKQASIVFIIALLMSASLFVFSKVFYEAGNSGISNVLGVSMFATILSSLFTGLLVPYTFMKLKMDPANASGPIGTAIQDFLSILIYFVIASALLV